MVAFPGLKITAIEAFSKEDKVAAYLTFSGVQSKAYLDLQPTHRSVYFYTQDYCCPAFTRSMVCG